MTKRGTHSSGMYVYTKTIKDTPPSLRDGEHTNHDASDVNGYFCVKVIQFKIDFFSIKLFIWRTLGFKKKD
jgi:hypothetical protein